MDVEKLIYLLKSFYLCYHGVKVCKCSLAEEILNAKDLSRFLKYDYSKHSFNLLTSCL